MSRPVLLLLIVALAVPSSAQVADDLFFFGRRAPAVGARMAGMAGASVAGLGDWSASYANPAGIGYLRSRQAAVSAHGYAQGRYSAFGSRFDSEGASISSVAFAAPLPVQRGALAVGAGYNETAIYTRRSEEDILAEEEGFQGELSVAAAVAVSPRAMLGVSVNAPVGRYEFDGLALRGNASEEPDFDAEMYGFNVRGGLSVDVLPTLRVGLTLESPTVLQIEETVAGLGRNDYRIATPWRVAAGVLVSAPDAFVAADVEFVDWSQARFLTDDARFAEENSIANALLDPVLNVRLGGEYRIGIVAFRTGAAFQPDPRFEAFRPEAVRQHYAVGLGLRITQNARIDAAFTHTRLADGARGTLFDRDGFFLWDVDHAFRNALQVGVDVRF